MHPFPPYIPVDAVQHRLTSIFPDSFPDRTILVSQMAARAIFVAIYGGFIDGTNRYFRPSTVIRFSNEQAELSQDSDRWAWVSVCQTAGYKPSSSWYADNTREPLRDDLIRNRAIPIGIIRKKEGVAPTSPAPIYCLSRDFSELFDPNLGGDALEQAIAAWREQHLDPMVLRRMKILAAGIEERMGQVRVSLPETGIELRLAPGEASTITRDVCQELVARIMRRPVITHVSISDQKIFPELARAANAVGLDILPSAELPDVVAVDIGHKDKKLRLAFIEVVFSDGPVTELRKQALMKIANDAGVPDGNVQFITAFEDRNAPAFKKRFSELAIGSLVWFRSEPDMLIRIESLATEAD